MSDLKLGIATSPFIFAFMQSFEQDIEIIGDNIFDEKYVENFGDFDLIIFPGGADINPRIYGQRNKYSVGIDSERDEIESEVFRIGRLFGLTMFGVCRGHQLINALMGGHLVQDIYKCTQKYHCSPHTLTKSYKNKDALLEGIATVNSLHHQGVIKVGQNLIPSSSHDGIIETTAGKGIYTTQFHPEFMLKNKNIRTFFDKILNWAEKRRVEKNTYSTIKNKLTKREIYRSFFDTSTTTATRPRIRIERLDVDLMEGILRNIGGFVYFQFNNGAVLDYFTSPITYTRIINIIQEREEIVADEALIINDLEDMLNLDDDQERMYEEANENYDYNIAVLEILNGAKQQALNCFRIAVEDNLIILDDINIENNVVFTLDELGHYDSHIYVPQR